MAAPQTTTDESRRAAAHWAWVTLACATGLATLGVASWAADRLVLRWAYGPERVEREQLRVVAHKPALEVSNGDRPEGGAFRHFLTTLTIWLTLCAGALVALWRLLPGEYRVMVRSLPRAGCRRGRSRRCSSRP